MIHGNHLTTEQMDRLLGNPSARSESMHLQQCARCYEELRSLEQLFGALRVESAAVASQERARAVLPQRRPVRAWMLGTATAALVVTAIAVPVFTHHAPAPVAGSTQANTVRNTVEPISDEALLNSIQDDLSASEPAALRPLAVRSGAAQSNSRKN